MGSEGSLGGAIGFTAAKFAARGMAMDIALEFGPEGVHVAHVAVGGRIDTPGVRDRGDETFLDPDEKAETYWRLVEQDAVSTRPFGVHITNGPQNSEFVCLRRLPKEGNYYFYISESLDRSYTARIA